MNFFTDLSFFISWSVCFPSSSSVSAALWALGYRRGRALIRDVCPLDTVWTHQGFYTSTPALKVTTTSYKDHLLSVLNNKIARSCSSTEKMSLEDNKRRTLSLPWIYSQQEIQRNAPIQNAPPLSSCKPVWQSVFTHWKILHLYSVSASSWSVLQWIWSHLGTLGWSIHLRRDTSVITVHTHSHTSFTPMGNLV